MAAHSASQTPFHTQSVRVRTGPGAVTSRYVVPVNAAATALSILLAAGVGGALGSYAGVVASRGWRGSLEGRSKLDARAFAGVVTRQAHALKYRLTGVLCEANPTRCHHQHCSQNTRPHHCLLFSSLALCELPVATGAACPLA